MDLIIDRGDARLNKNQLKNRKYSWGWEGIREMKRKLKK